MATAFPSCHLFKPLISCLANKIPPLPSGVAVGSSIGHVVGGWFGGGGSAGAAEQAPAAGVSQDAYASNQDAYAAQPMDNGLYNSQSASQSQSQAQGPCANDIKSFTQCMDQNRGDLSICGWYMDQLKACQAAARPY